MRYLSPTMLEEALAALAERPMTVLAGGTDIYPALKDRPLTADTLDIGRIADLQRIAREDDCWRIGATATWTDLIAAALPSAFDGLKLAAREIGSVQIQNAATVMGNLCNASPAADGVPCLLTLDASVELQSLGGTRILPLREFITGVRRTARRSGELAVAIRIPALPTDLHSGFLKLGARKYLVISIAMIACALSVKDNRLTDIRLAVGACSPVAERLTALEQALTGLDVADALAFTPEDAHLSPLAPIDDVRGTAAYRREAVCRLIRRTIAQAIPEAVAA